MERVLDVRGLRCPLPLIRARAALPGTDALIVLTTDPEARIDLAALAADEGRRCDIAPDGEGWRITLRR
jgi:tRNA 2-thiouridine synthesizing protein A